MPRGGMWKWEADVFWPLPDAIAAAPCGVRLATQLAEFWPRFKTYKD